MYLREFIERSISALGELYSPGEARSIVLMLCESRLGTKSFTHIIEPQTEITADKCVIVNADLQRLIQGEPIQYVLGKAEFCGREFSVSKDVLIPRQETEELVSLALKILPAGGRVLDMCTGSGCIAWSVALESTASEVVGVDISDAALMMAESQFSDGRVSFLKRDVLDAPDEQLGKFDLILSNPPYILDSQKSCMRRNVLDYEPHLALFVKDEDPLVFYRAVGNWCLALMKDEGTCIVEINEDLGKMTGELFAEMGFSDIQLIKDVFEKNRLIIFSK